jgi:hypothetical protein
MKPVREMAPIELGAYVQSYLRDQGIDVVLSGGAVVAIYTSDKYVSQDLDFVNRHFANRDAIRKAMEEIGFHYRGRQFEHPESEFFVEFPPGPLSFGKELVTKIVEIKTETGILQTISPTDCVKDRLAWYYHTGDRQCLSQAVMVSKDQDVDIEEIRSWSEGEGKLEDFEEIKNRLFK